MGGPTIPISSDVRNQVLELARSQPEISLRELGHRFGIGKETVRKFVLRAGVRAPAPVIHHGHAPGHSPSPEYVCWQSMRDRCANPKNRSFADYGGRGITVCAEWERSFAAFLAAVGPKPSPAHSIDRIDNERGYEPGNVRWATRTEQNRNKRNARMVTLDGITRTVPEWCVHFGISIKTFDSRTRAGWPIHIALRRQVHADKRNRRAACVR